MEKPKNWDSVKANTGDYESLKLGGHEVIIKDAYEYTGMTGNISLKIEVDINGNDKQKGFYQKQYDNNTNSDKKWPSASCKYISLKDNDTCIALYKGFTTIIENSNPGYKWNFDEKTLIGKKLCGVYGLEEFEDNEGNVKTAVKLVQFRSIDKVDEAKVPKVKTLNSGYVEYADYISNRNQSSNTSNPFAGLDDIVEIDSNLLD